MSTVNHRIRLRPRDDTLSITQSRTTFTTDVDGFIERGPDRGFFVQQTRLLSRYRYTIDGRAWTPLALSNVAQHSWLGYYVARPPGDTADDPDAGPGGALSSQPIELRLSRFVGDGFHEDVDITNFTTGRVAFSLRLAVDADFADRAETGGPRLQSGERRRDWRAVGTGRWELAFRYHAEHRCDDGRAHAPGSSGSSAAAPIAQAPVAHLRRGLVLRIERAGSPPDFAEETGVISFPIELEPRATWHACITGTAEIDEAILAPLYGCHAFSGIHNEQDRRRDLFLRGATSFETAESETLAPVVSATLEQARRDLAALRLYDLDRGERAWVAAAGLPTYLALFGRDSLTAAWQSGLLGPDLLVGTLPELSRLQGRAVDDWRDERPGRMLHQVDTGPLAALCFTPLGRYYGSITTSGFYPVALSLLWHLTGDKTLVRPHVASALAALRWLDEDARVLGRGFYAYQTRSRQGVKHQAWKDSHDAIVYEDGRQVEPPIAACEEQGFVYMAKLHLSELLWWLDEKEEARRLWREAAELKRRFNEAFWMEARGSFAMGLDAEGRQITSIGSNPGHCLATGIADAALVERTASRLMGDDLFSGWGVRTLSSRHPAFNPYSYHRGTVWPVEQAAFALGFMRYGLHDHVERLVRAQFEAAALFENYRLPELFSGHARDGEHPFPSHYPGANSPQAWSASATFCLLQSLLGAYPYAPLHLLLVDPHLPAWLPEVTLRGLRVGRATATIRFFRRANGSSDHSVLDLTGPLHVVRQPSPWSLTAGIPERVVDALRSLVPG
jgi:glycogen debranching enzyme